MNTKSLIQINEILDNALTGNFTKSKLLDFCSQIKELVNSSSNDDEIENWRIVFQTPVIKQCDYAKLDQCLNKLPLKRRIILQQHQWYYTGPQQDNMERVVSILKDGIRKFMYLLEENFIE